jgi:hypothetical protein
VSTHENRCPRCGAPIPPRQKRADALVIGFLLALFLMRVIVGAIGVFAAGDARPARHPDRRIPDALSLARLASAPSER